MFIIKYTKNVQGALPDYFTAAHHTYATRQEAAEGLASWAERKVIDKGNPELYNAYKLRYGKYTEPTDEQLIKWIVQGGGCETLAEALAKLERGYDATEDPAWYTWPLSLEKFQFECVTYEVADWKAENLLTK